MAVIRKVHGGRTTDPVGALVSRWQSGHLFAVGSYSNMPLGSSLAHCDALAEPGEMDRLFFAGEATERVHIGTVHGRFSERHPGGAAHRGLRQGVPPVGAGRSIAVARSAFRS